MRFLFPDKKNTTVKCPYCGKSDFELHERSWYGCLHCGSSVKIERSQFGNYSLTVILPEGK